MEYDIIGDIHGQADKLEALLVAMGYSQRRGAYRHPSRKAIFVGDLIDRGPRQVDSCRIVRDMVGADVALAVMGNHEFNAVAWHLRDPEEAADGDTLRTRKGELGLKNRQQHSAFLSEVEGTAMHADIIDWFLSLPLWLDLPGLRVVHACWHDGYMAELAPLLGAGQTLTSDLMVRASRRGDPVFRAVEGLTKGLEVALPAGHSFRDKDGHERQNVRIRWWDQDATSYRDLAMMPDEERAQLPDITVDDVNARYDQRKPVFFGHYWMRGDPELQAERMACVDYSAGKGGPLVAYRWFGEDTLHRQNFVQTACLQ